MKKTTTASNNYMKSLLAPLLLHLATSISATINILTTLLVTFSSRGTYYDNHLVLKVKIMYKLQPSINHVNTLLSR